MPKIFPPGIAMGDAFYDRKLERAELKKNIDNITHTVLIAPRRFGKTSLIKKVIDDHKLHYIWIDLMTITSGEELQESLLNHISNLIVQLGKTENKIKDFLSKYFGSLKPEVTWGIPPFIKVKLNPKATSQESIVEALLRLDEMAQDGNSSIVIVCDEFQEIARIDKEHTLQASIRHAAERAQAICYLFSGSKPQPLLRIFNGKQNPLYELCDMMTINRITKKDYIEYLQAQAMTKWGKSLSDECLTKIFNNTQYYPKYINALCSKLWGFDTTPDVEIIDDVWKEYIFSRKASIREELNGLKLNELRLLKSLSESSTHEPFGQNFLKTIELSQSSVQRSLEALLEKGLVINTEGAYAVIDPTFKCYFDMF